MTGWAILDRRSFGVSVGRMNEPGVVVQLYYHRHFMGSYIHVHLLFALVVWYLEFRFGKSMSDVDGGGH